MLVLFYSFYHLFIETKNITVSETTEKQATLIQLEPRQLKDLIITIDYVTKELKNIGIRLAAIEDELKILRIESKK